MAENRQERSRRGGRPAATALLLMASLVVIFAGIKAAENLIVPFLLAVFIAVIVSSVMLWLRKHGVGPAVTLILMVFALIAVVVGLTGLVGSAVDDFRGNMPQYQEQLSKKWHAVSTWLDNKGWKVPELDVLLEQIDPKPVLGFTGSLLGSLSGLLGNSFLILLTVVFMLLEGSSFAAKLDALPEGVREVTAQYREVVASIRRYMAFKTVICIMTGVLVTLLLLALRVEYAVLWGLLAFVLNYIPSIGSIIAALPAVLLALVLNGVWPAVWVAVGYVVINVAIGNVIEPRVMGKGMGLSALIVFLSLVFWGWLLGPVGMLLSVPLTISVKIGLMAGERTRPIALLLGGGTAPPQAAS
jgi:AI-2 transport protein TqsA